MAERRKSQEDDAVKLLEKAQRKRKKFKDALLEKALKSRGVGVEGNVEAIPAGGSTKASLLQKVNKPPVEDLSEEEQQRKDEEKKVLVAAIRRKFKDQYKKVLDALMLKNLMKEEQGIVKKTKPGRKTQRPPAEAACLGVEPEVGALLTALPAGSALAAVRDRGKGGNDENCENQAVVKPVSRVPRPKAPGVNEDMILDGAAEEPAELSEQEVEEKKTRLLNSKMQQLKIAAYLAALAESKKTEENKKMVTEQRVKKRVAILAARVLKEVNYF